MFEVDLSAYGLKDPSEVYDSLRKSFSERGHMLEIGPANTATSEVYHINGATVALGIDLKMRPEKRGVRVKIVSPSVTSIRSVRGIIDSIDSRFE